MALLHVALLCALLPSPDAAFLSRQEGARSLIGASRNGTARACRSRGVRQCAVKSRRQLANRTNATSKNYPEDCSQGQLTLGRGLAGSCPAYGPAADTLKCAGVCIKAQEGATIPPFPEDNEAILGLGAGGETTYTGCEDLYCKALEHAGMFVGAKEESCEDWDMACVQCDLCPW